MQFRIFTWTRRFASLDVMMRVLYRILRVLQSGL